MPTYNIQNYENLRKEIRAERELRGESKERVILNFEQELEERMNENPNNYHLAIGSTESPENPKKSPKIQLYDELDGYVDDKYLE